MTKLRNDLLWSCLLTSLFLTRKMYDSWCFCFLHSQFSQKPFSADLMNAKAQAMTLTKSFSRADQLYILRIDLFVKIVFNTVIDVKKHYENTVF